MADLSLILLHEESRGIIQVSTQNDTSYSFVLTGEITFNDRDPISLKGNLPAGSLGHFGEFPFDYINDYPHFELNLERYSTQGLEETISAKIKPKPKHMIQLSPLEKWNLRPGRSYTIWNDRGSQSSKNRIPDRDFSLQEKKNPTDMRKVVIRDLSDLSVYQREIDLHAEALFDDLSRVKPEAIFKRQMEAFRQYLRKVKKTGIKRVFIIHGVGSGRLKSEIARALEWDPDVAEYYNKYHPRYGFGATEVVFR